MSTQGVTPKRANPPPQLKSPHQSVTVHGEDEQNKNGDEWWKWVKKKRQIPKSNKR